MHFCGFSVLCFCFSFHLGYNFCFCFFYLEGRFFVSYLHNHTSIFVLHHCLGTLVPTVDITITHGGGPFIAGLSYNLTCTVTLENATRTPTVGWLDPNNNSLSSSSNITVGDTVTVNCSTYTTTLQFTTLHTFHGGQYSCQATLGVVNNTAAVNVTVLSTYEYVIMVLVSVSSLHSIPF